MQDDDFHPSARVIADSISLWGHRLVTMEVVIHRFVLSEFNTHRSLSRNSASSRAVPVRTMIDAVTNTPAIPLEWPAEQRGMQGGDQITDPGVAREVWLNARDAALLRAEALVALGVHKSVVNRLLEPFMAHTVIVSATDWDGFWAQRCSPLAQPEIRAAAHAMRQAYDASTPAKLDVGEWHLPYISDDDRAVTSLVNLRRISVARCARVSYLTHDNTRAHDLDLDLYTRLITADPPHASPLEHVAAPVDTATRGNFTGWVQLRHIIFGGLR